MSFSRKSREQKVKELESNKEFMDYAREHHKECKRVGDMNGCKTFEEYLISEVFNIYDDFTLWQLLKTTYKKNSWQCVGNGTWRDIKG